MLTQTVDQIGGSVRLAPGSDPITQREAKCPLRDPELPTLRCVLETRAARQECRTARSDAFGAAGDWGPRVRLAAPGGVDSRQQEPT